MGRAGRVNLASMKTIRSSRFEGIRYLTGPGNRRVAVQIDLSRYGPLWEEFYDTLLTARRAEEGEPDWSADGGEVGGEAFGDDSGDQSQDSLPASSRMLR